jgi:ubiquinone/menaquinone biosynthesis C-methylase UbiE
MGGSFRDRFKDAVEKNFDRSVDIYEAFEAKHRLFEDVTRRLCELAGPFAPSRVLDVGCGTGISTDVILRSLPGRSAVFGIDISEAMLEKARTRFRGIPNVSFMKGDAERLTDCYTRPFDAVFYSASLFLIPDFAASLEQSCRLLAPGGMLLISFYKGLFDAQGRDAMASVFPDMRYQYGAFPLGDLLKCLDFHKNLKTGQADYHFEIIREFLQDFLTIPAQSAGLYPKLAYEERLPLIRNLCFKVTEEVDPLFMGWTFLICRKA